MKPPTEGVACAATAIRLPAQHYSATPEAETKNSVIERRAPQPAQLDGRNL